MVFHTKEARARRFGSSAKRFGRPDFRRYITNGKVTRERFQRRPIRIKRRRPRRNQSGYGGMDNGLNFDFGI